MSWEEMSSREYICPCGKGKYSVKDYTDDWNGSETKWEMKCQECNDNYKLYPFGHYDSGMWCEHYCWVKNEAIEKRDEIRTELNETIESTIHLAREKYMNNWLRYFKDKKSKKAIWRELTDDGEKYPCLSTFYIHTKGMNIEEYLRKEFSYSNISAILKKLEINDEELNRMIELTQHVERKLEREERHIQRNGFK